MHAIDILRTIVDRFPAFTPHGLLRSGHLQTVAATIFKGHRYPHRAKLHPIAFDNGDVTYVHDDQPADWRPTSPAALLVHGLGGCGRSSYMIRVAGRLNELGIRTFRFDFRACGYGEGRARLPYTAGCSDDILLALKLVAKVCPAAPLSLIGFSIGGNAALKLLGELHDQLPTSLERAAVVSPPIDLRECVNRQAAAPARYYDRHIVRLLYKQLRRSDLLVEHAPHILEVPRPQTQREFDEVYTARAWGFDTPEDFYDANSSLPHLSGIRIPTLLLASRDDPMVPHEIYEQIEPNPALAIHMTEFGGHLGFIGRTGVDADRRWMDWRIIEWLTADRAIKQRAIAA